MKTKTFCLGNNGWILTFRINPGTDGCNLKGAGVLKLLASELYLSFFLMEIIRIDLGRGSWGGKTKRLFKMIKDKNKRKEGGAIFFRSP